MRPHSPLPLTHSRSLTPSHSSLLLSDEFYKETKAYFDEHLIDGPKPYFNTGESCSVWFEPTVVWEIRGADISVSPMHRAAVGKVHPSRGLALR